MVVLLAGVLGLWAILGTVAVKVKDDANATLDKVQQFQVELKTKQQTLVGLTKDLEALQSQFAEIKNTTAFMALLTQVQGLDKKRSDLDARTTKRIDDILVRLPPTKAAGK